MPRKAATPSLAETQAAPGGVGAVDKALSLLSAFRPGDTALGLAELAERTRLYKSTALRLIASLEHARLLQRRADGLYAASFSLEAEVLPVLQALVARTRESAALHVRQGEQRLCLYRVDSPQPLRDHLRAGDLLPLEQGAGGRVLLAFGGARGKAHEQIRAQGYAELDGDRVEGLAGIAAPVFKLGGELVGALTLSLPSSRLKPQLAAEVRRAARDLSRRLGAEG
ncbi:MAG TPA: IclR family transcriptional regulator [Roseateles sp.]|nr:IclR family transcriptional regulator [Roseateles sp.]